MSTLLDDPDTLESEDQEAFNLAVWAKVLENEFLCGLPHRIETDHLGQIIMLPPPTPEHGEGQSKIVMLLGRSMTGGSVITECPLSTSEAVKGVDVVWISQARREPQRGRVFFTQAPEICIEVVSPSNSRRQLREKKRLVARRRRTDVVLRQSRARYNAGDLPSLSGFSPNGRLRR